MKKILLLTTGGTIASVESKDGLKPQLQVKELLDSLPEIPDNISVDGEIIMSKDSTNMQPEDWVTMAQAIYRNYEDYDGFVITHGTDTLGYTSAALSYMLQGLQKPVVITGSQVPITFKENDAERNMADALRFAREEIGGVFVVFDGRVILGTRAIKMRTKSYDAFESINHPYVAFIHDGAVNYHQKPAQKLTEIDYRPEINTDVFLLKLFPGAEPDIFDYLSERYRGIIIESFGSGGLPFSGRNLLEKVEEMTEKGIAVVITTQCLEEGENMLLYEVGRKAAASSIILTGDMNTEAIVAKLMWTLGQKDSLQEIKKMMETKMAEDFN